MHSRQIQVAECGDRSSVPVHRQSIDGCAFQQEGHDLCFVKNPRNQLAIFQIIGRQGGFIFVKTPVNLIHSVPGIIDRFPFAEQFLGDGLKRE